MSSILVQYKSFLKNEKILTSVKTLTKVNNHVHQNSRILITVNTGKFAWYIKTTMTPVAWFML